MATLRILLVEDCVDDADLLHFQLEDAGLCFDLRCVSSERMLLEALETFTPSVAVSDLNLPGYSGLAALALLHQRLPDLPLVLLTGADETPVPGVPATVLGKTELHRLPALLAGLPAGD
ncbi:MAG TPA: response regulator [Thermomonas sp.]|nr:response regulator [Thermomonas sp.]